MVGDVHAQAEDRTSKRKAPALYRDKPKRTISEARALVNQLLADADDEPAGIEVARDVAFEHEIDDMMMLFDVAADLKLSPVDIGNAEWNGTTMWDEETVGFKLDGIEYRVVKDAATAERIAIRSVENDLKDSPEIFNQDFLQSHINMEKLREHVYDMEMEDPYVEELAKDEPNRFWQMASQIGIDEPEADEDGDVREPNDDEIDQVKRNHAKEMASDPIDRLTDMGVEHPLAHAIEIVGIDIDSAAKEAVATDGWAHFLSGYHTTKHGYVYWREN